MQIQWHISTIFYDFCVQKYAELFKQKSKKTVNINFFFINKRNVWYKQQKLAKKVLFNLDFLHKTSSYLLKFEIHQIHFISIIYDYYLRKIHFGTSYQNKIIFINQKRSG